VWGLSDDNDLQMVLFEHAKRHIKIKIEEDSLGDRTDIQLTSYNSPQKCPYDPKRISYSWGTPLNFTVPPKNPLSDPEPSSLASQIVDLRDSINAIFGERYGGRLLLLPQERHLVELFKRCDDHESFAYRVASLGGLATAISSSDINQLISKNSDNETIGNSGPLDLLGRYLRGQYKLNIIEVNKIMDILQNFNRMRRMYPVHTDRAKGVLEAHKFFKVGYPVEDHEKAGRKLLEFYREALKGILDLIKQNVAS
jgi:hypothetical protein